MKMMTYLQILSFARRGIMNRISVARDRVANCSTDGMRNSVKELSNLLDYLDEIDERIRIQNDLGE